jgi:erythromycin esterase
MQSTALLRKLAAFATASCLSEPQPNETVADQTQTGPALVPSLTDTPRIDPETEVRQAISAGTTAFAPSGMGVDFRSIGAIVGDARVVSLGEATHGIHEFYQLRLQILQHLVVTRDFNILAIEAPMVETEKLNRYILDGVGDPDIILAQLVFWIYNNEEFLHIIKWMREHNKTRSAASKLRIYGFDMQFAPAAAQNLLAYLRLSDRRLAGRVERELAVLADPFALETTLISHRAATRIGLVLDTVLSRLLKHAGPETHGRQRASRTSAIRYARLLKQFVELKLHPAEATRNAAMAANIIEILSLGGPRSRALIWAHNAHVAIAPEHSMGAALRRELGDDMLAIGTAFEKGGFNARDTSAPDMSIHPFYVGKPRTDSMEAMLSSLQAGAFLIDFRTFAKGSTAATWLSLSRPTRSIGATFFEGADEWSYEEVAALYTYDALIFIAEATPTRLAGAVLERSAAGQSTLKNHAFETLSREAGVPFWTQDRSSIAFGFRTAISNEDGSGGAQSAVLERAPRSSAASVYGSLSQEVDAHTYIGKSLRVQAMLRTEVSGVTNVAYFWLRAYPARRTAGQPLVLFRRVDWNDWKPAVLQFVVPAQTNSVAFGIALVGDGSVWIDDVELTSE